MYKLRVMQSDNSYVGIVLCSQLTSSSDILYGVALIIDDDDDASLIINELISTVFETTCSAPHHFALNEHAQVLCIRTKTLENTTSSGRFCLKGEISFGGN